MPDDEPSPGFFDSHAHLDRAFFGEDLDDVLDRAFGSGIVGMVTIGSGADPRVMEEAAALARDRESVWAAVGVHPHEADKAGKESFRTLESLLSEHRVVALGEIGLDYHYDFSSRRGQMEVFVRQLETAAEASMPVVVHCREAHEDCIRVLSGADLGERPGVIHCYTGDLETAGRYLDMGFYVSVPGVVTFRNAGDLVGAVGGLPSDRILVETDSPYLAPVPKRGRRNEPSYVRYTVEAVARIRGVSVSEAAAGTAANARRLFGIPTP